MHSRVKAFASSGAALVSLAFAHAANAQAPAPLPLENLCRAPFAMNFALTDIPGAVLLLDCKDYAAGRFSPAELTRVWTPPTKVDVAYGSDGKPGVLFNPIRESDGRYGMVIDLLLETRVDSLTLSRVKENYPSARIQYIQGASSRFDLAGAQKAFVVESSSLKDALLVQGMPRTIRVSLNADGLNALRCTLDALDDARALEPGIDATYNAINILTGSLNIDYRVINETAGGFEVSTQMVKSNIEVMPPRVTDEADAVRREIVLDQFARNVRAFARSCDAKLNDRPDAQLPAYRRLNAIRGGGR